MTGQGKHALVTGGAGFIGAHLVRELLRRGYKVTVWDNLHTGRESNLEEVRAQIDFAAVDVRHATVADAAALKFGRVQVIFNMACPASPPHYQKDPVYTWETSLMGISNMLKIAESQGARLLHASTSEIYGDPLEHPQRESTLGDEARAAHSARA